MQDPRLKENEKLYTVNDGLQLIQNTNHLLFGSDALLLAGYLRKAERAAELGAGNGIVSLLCAARGRFAHVDGYEFQPEVRELFQRNIELNGLSHRVTALERDIRALPAGLGGSYECIFSNPPYMKTSAGKCCLSDARQIARHETAGEIGDFAAAAGMLLKHGGEAVFVYRPDRLADLIFAFRQAGLEPKRLTFVSSDPAHAPSVLLLAGKKGGKSGLYLTPHFFLKDASGVQSPEYTELLEKGIFHERFFRP